MARTINRRVSFALGEIDPLLVPREDVEQLQGAAKRLVNYVPRPQGGVERRAGTELIGRVRRPLESVSLAGAAWTAPNGGTAADLLEPDGAFVTTTELATAAAYVVATWTFGSPQALDLVDVIDCALVAAGGGGGGTTPLPPPPGPWPWDPIDPDGLRLASGEEIWLANDAATAHGQDASGSDPAELPGAMAVQYLDGATWRDLGPRLSIGSAVRSRRFGGDPGTVATSTSWRLVVNASAGGGARVFRAVQVRAWREAGAAGPEVLRCFKMADQAGRYLAVFTAGNVEFWRDGLRVGSAAHGLGAGAIKTLDTTQRLDTIVLFHASAEPLAIMRQGSDHDWDWRARAFEHVPVYDFTGANANAVNEVQMLRFVNYLSGETFNLTCEDFTTASIAYGGSGAATAAAIQSALNALPNIGAGGVTVAAGSGGANTVDITFGGPLTKGQDWAELVPRSISTASGGVVTATITQGEPGGEAKFGAARGWPACGTVHAQRLWLGGLASLPDTLLASRPGDLWNLRTKGGRPDAAIDVTLDTESQTVIRRVTSARSLMLFTSSGVFFWSSEPPRPDAPGIKNAVRMGIHPTVPPLDVDGAVMFVPASGADFVELVYDNQIENFQAVPVATMGAHLITRITDAAARRRASNEEGDVVVLVRDIGTATGLSIMRSEQVTGAFRIETQGVIRAVAGDDAGGLFWTVDRAGVVTVERWSRALWMDCGRLVVRAPGQPPITEITGLVHLSGRSVTVSVDGAEIGQLPVVAGRITLPLPAQREAQAGLSFAAEIEALPLFKPNDPRGRAGTKLHVTSVEVRASGIVRALAVKANGSPRAWQMNLRKLAGQEFDRLAMDDVASGWIGRMQGLKGWGEDGTVTVTCTSQSPHVITGLTIEGRA